MTENVFLSLNGKAYFMATIKRFEDIEAWQRARVLAKEIYFLTYNTLISKDIKLKEQMRGACGSVMDNIAEGFERGTSKEFINFLRYAKGSCGELRSQLYRVFDQAYIEQDKFESLCAELEITSKLISRFISYLKKSNYNGQNF